MPLDSAAARCRRCLIGIAVGVSLSVLLAACSSKPPELAGTWQGVRTTLTITQDKNTYKIISVSPKSLLGGNYSSEYRNNRLLLSGPLAPLCGDMQYDERTGKLIFCEEEFVRVSK